MAEIGSTLREARMRARIDISEVEAQTKIRAKYLRALENEEWDLLPGSVFVKSFLKTYGDYLGLDTRLLIDEFRRRYERPSDHDPRSSSAVTGGVRERERRERGRRQRGGRGRPGARGRGVDLSRFMSPPAVVGAVLVAIVVVLLLIGLNSGGNGSNTNLGAGPATTASTAQSTTPTTTTTRRHRTLSAKLTLVPTGTIYICVKRPTGKQLVGGTYTAGQTVPKVSGKTLLVTLGNANATMKVDGKPYTLTASSTPIGLRVDRGGVRPISPGPTCS